MTRSGRSVRDSGASVSMRPVSFNGDTTKSIFFNLYLQQQSFNRSLYNNRLPIFTSSVK